MQNINRKTFIVTTMSALLVIAYAIATPAAEKNVPGPLPNAVPSAGCATAPGQGDDRVIRVDDIDFKYSVSLPPGHRAGAPFPLAFSFNGYMQDAFENKAIVVVMQSSKGGWTVPLVSQEVTDRHARYFTAMLETMKREYCVDEGRIVAAGMSTGGAFSNLIGCRFGDQLLAIAPVGAWMPQRYDCKGNPAVIVIHGIDDTIVHPGGGEYTRDFYIKRNQCSRKGEPDVAAMRARVRKARDEKREDYACVDYPGCASGAVRWCLHSEGGFDDTTHQWPKVGGDIIWQFVESLKPVSNRADGPT